MAVWHDGRGHPGRAIIVYRSEDLMSKRARKRRARKTRGANHGKKPNS